MKTFANHFVKMSLAKIFLLGEISRETKPSALWLCGKSECSEAITITGNGKLLIFLKFLFLSRKT